MHGSDAPPAVTSHEYFHVPDENNGSRRFGVLSASDLAVDNNSAPLEALNVPRREALCTRTTFLSRQVNSSGSFVPPVCVGGMDSDQESFFLGSTTAAQSSTIFNLFGLHSPLKFSSLSAEKSPLSVR